MRRLSLSALAAAFTAAVVLASPAAAAPAPAKIADAPAGAVRVLASTGIRGPLDQVKAQAEAALGRPIVIEYGGSQALQTQIEAGGAFEVAIVSRAVIDDLAGKGRIVAGSARDLARAPVAIAQRGGAPARIDTPQALKAALQGAKTVRYASAGTATPTLLNTVTALGLTEALKTRLDGSSSDPALRTVTLGPGEYEFLVRLHAELTPVEGWTILGPWPASLETPVVMTAGVGAGGDQAAGRALIAFLAGKGADAAVAEGRMRRP